MSSALRAAGPRLSGMASAGCAAPRLALHFNSLAQRESQLSQNLSKRISQFLGISSANLSTSNDAILPRLPVPPLNNTLQKYLRTVKPHLNREEMITTSTIIKEFGGAGGVGSKLQELLKQRANSTDNWLAEWWLHVAYLSYRFPVVVYSSPGHVWPFQKFNSKNDQLYYAARVILGALDYKKRIDNDELPQDKAGKDLLDMQQYKKVLGTCRIPGTTTDSLSYNNFNHISVFHNNHIFILSVVGDDGVVLNEEQLFQQLTDIVNASAERSEYPIGILTTENRDTWGKVYGSLINDMTNKDLLKAIEQSIFSVCLDKGCSDINSECSARQTVAAAQTIHGGGSKLNGGNRWFDKTVQFIIGEDGINGLTYEHSPAEGQPIALLVDHIVDYINNNQFSDKQPSNLVKAMKRLDFNISSDIKHAINTAKINLDKLVDNLDLSCFTFKSYGKEFIKSHNLSPDSYIQMAIQLAFYRIHKVPGAHYETASTRKYTGGRTETIRSCSEESIAFAKSMLDNNATLQEKLDTLRAAVKAHKDYTVEASNGFGVDRHLLGLKLVALENGIQVPKLYSDAGYIKSAHMRVSSSQVASRCEGFMCFGPLVSNGYSTCYNPRHFDIVFSTSAFNESSDTDANRYRNALETSLDDMYNILLKSTKSVKVSSKL